MAEENEEKDLTEDESIKQLEDTLAEITKKDESDSFEMDMSEEDDAEEESTDEYEDDTEEEGDLGDKQEEEEEAVQNPEYVAAAKKRGFTDEEIETLSPKVLKNIGELMQYKAPAAAQEKQELEETKEVQAAIKKIEYTPEAIAKLNDRYGEGYYEDIVKPLLDNNNAQADVINSLKQNIDSGAEARLEKSLERDEATFNQMLDEAAKDYPVFGTWDAIPLDPQGLPDVNTKEVQERLRMWTTTKAFRDQGYSMEDATKEALRWYKGAGLETEVKKKVIKDLAARKKKFVARPTSKKVKRSFASAKEEEIQITKDAMKKAGLTVD